MKYTLNHSLPIIEPAIDKIASTGTANLAGNINALAQATDRALDVQGAAAVEAAREAAEETIENSDLVEGTDPRLVRLTTAEGYSHLFLDEMRRTSWLGVTETGGLPYFTENALGSRLSAALAAMGYSYAVTDGLRLGDLRLDLNGHLSAHTLAKIKEYLDVAPPTPPGEGAVIISEIVGAGDSLMIGEGGGGATVPAVVASALGLGVHNPSVAGEASADIALRAGALRLDFQVPDATIPASGPVVAIAVTPNNGWRLAAGNPLVGKFQGSLNGIPGALVHDQSTNAWTFTRTTAGDAVRVSGGLASFVSVNASHRGGFHIIRMGRNDMYEGQIMRDLAAYIDWLGHDGYAILSIPPTETETAGTPARAILDSINNNAELAYPGNYIDTLPWMIDTALSFMGITPTPADTAVITARAIPPSLRSDHLHFNANGYTAEGLYAATQIKTLNLL